MSTRSARKNGVRHDRAPQATPRNERGEPATHTVEETINRLEEKSRRSRGASTRDRIRAQMARRAL